MEPHEGGEEAHRPDPGAGGALRARVARGLVLVALCLLVAFCALSCLAVVEGMTDPRAGMSTFGLAFSAGLTALVLTIGWSLVRPRARAAAPVPEGGAVGNLVRGRTHGLATCPYCKDDIKTADPEGVVRCPTCESLHHTPCWREHGGCSVFACRRSPPGREGARNRAGL